VHFEQVLVDREQLRVLYLLDEVGEALGIPNLELLFGVLVLLHVEAILNSLIPLD